MMRGAITFKLFTVFIKFFANLGAVPDGLVCWEPLAELQTLQTQ